MASVERVWSTGSLINSWQKCEKCGLSKATSESYLELSIKVEYPHTLWPSNFNARYKLSTYEPGGICKSVHDNTVVIEKNSGSNPNVYWQENG